MSKERQHYNCIPGYDMVARNEAKQNREKIKELEKKLGSGGSNMVEKVLYQTDEARLYPFNGLHKHYIDAYVTFVDGKKYNVVLDGTTYECVAVSVAGPDGASSVALGNIHLAIPDFADTGEPFMIVPSDDNYAIFDKDGFSSVKISTMEEKSSGSGGGGKFVVTAAVDATYNHVTWDKTFDETWAVRISGQEVQLKFTDGINADNYDVCEYEKVDGEPNKLKFAIPATFDKSTSSLTGRTVEWSKRDNSLVLYIGALDSQGLNFFEMGTFYPAGIK